MFEFKSAIKVTEPESNIIIGDQDITSSKGAPRMAEFPFAINEFLSWFDFTTSENWT